MSLNTTQRLINALQDARSKLEAVKQKEHEPIAIIGIGCRLPGGVEHPEAFWQQLRNGVDAIRPVPADRWDGEAYYDPNPEADGKIYAREGGFIESPSPYDFDAHFFGISPREALSLDPQQRLLLEVTWEALENAGVVPASLQGSQTGVFVGICANDYFNRLLHRDQSEIDAYLATGNSNSVASGRLSYVLGLQGPSLSVDTACSSSLVAVHLAVMSLRQRESDLALAGGVNQILSPELSINFSRARMLSPDSRCKTFDAAANGFVRAEGAGMILLKRLSDAQADEDRILGLIRGSAINQDGRTSGLTVPNGPAQQAVILRALERAGIEPSEIGYIEAHGTGTSLGDPIEVNALGAVFGKKQQRKDPLLIGSVKTNIGHLEGAAGIAGLIKVVLSMQHGEIPPSLHFSTPNPYIPWEQWPIEVPTELSAWPSGPKIAGVSSFGFSGTNAHVVLQEAAAPQGESGRGEEGERGRYLLTLSAKTEEALRAVAKRYQTYLQTTPESLADLCFTANTGRSHFKHRLSMVLANKNEAASSKLALARRLAAFVAGEQVAQLAQGTVPQTGTSKIAFLFTGQGAQYVGMGRELYQTEPVFRQVLEECDEILRKQQIIARPLRQAQGTALLSLLYPSNMPKEGAPSLLDQTRYTQVALFALGMALTKLWNSWGIFPAVVIGHSVGEYVAACVAGVFSLEDGLKLMAERGRLMQQTQSGQMVAVFADSETVAAYIDGSSVSIAAINGPQLTVISGPRDACQAVERRIQAADIRTKPLKVSHAFHSSLMEPILNDFFHVARKVAFSPPQLPLISNLTGKVITAADGITTPDYWVRHLRQAVRFYDGIKRLPEMGIDTFIEIGPASTLLGMTRRGLPDYAPSRPALWLPSLRATHSDGQQMLNALSQLYVSGVEVDWAGFYQHSGPHRRIALPTYAFQRERHGMTPITRTSSAVQKDDRNDQATAQRGHSLLGRRLYSPLIQDICFESQISLQSTPFLKDHKILGQTIALAAGYVEMAISAAKLLFGAESVTLEHVIYQSPLLLSEKRTETVQFIVENLNESDRSGSFKVVSLAGDAPSPDEGRALTPVAWRTHAQGIMRSGENAANDAPEPAPTNPAKQAIAEALGGLYPKGTLYEEIDRDSFYSHLYAYGCHFGPTDQGVQRLWRKQSMDEAVGEVVLPEALASEFEQYAFHPALLDACSHVLLSLLPNSSSKQLFLAMGQERIEWCQRPSQRVWVHATLDAEASTEGSVIGHIAIYAATDMPSSPVGRKIAVLQGYLMKQVTRDSLANTLRESNPDDFRNLIYEINWQETNKISKSTKRPLVPLKVTLASTLWLLFADQDGLTEQLCQSLHESQATYIKVLPGQGFAQLERNLYTIDPQNPAHYTRILEVVQQAKYESRANFRGVMHLWSVQPSKQTDDDLINDLSYQQSVAVESALLLTQALAKLPKTKRHARFRLFLITRGAQAVCEQDTACPLGMGRLEHPLASALWGLSRVIELEHPELHLRYVDLDPAPQPGYPESLSQIFAHDRDQKQVEPLIALRQGLSPGTSARRFVPRLVKATLRSDEESFQSSDQERSRQLAIGPNGSLDELEWWPSLRTKPNADQIEIQTEAVSLNFRDVLIALGIYQGQGADFGLECAGRVVKIGKDVTRFKVGDAVMALASPTLTLARQQGTFKDYLTIDQELVVPKPETLSMAEAASIPMVFLTAYMALMEVGQISAGERVLIHSAAGGVGLAALQLAQQMGAELYVTASPGFDEHGINTKWEYLRSLGVKQIMTSRTLDFAEQIMSATNGQGVDVILGALTNETIPANMAILAPGGRCVDIGRTENSNTEVEFSDLTDGKRYHSFNLWDKISHSQQEFDAIFQALASKFANGSLKPLPITTYDRQRVKEAFRFMQQSKHIGKIVVSLAQDKTPSSDTLENKSQNKSQNQPLGSVDKQSTVLITGGLGGLGLEVAQSFAKRNNSGATPGPSRCLALLGRTQPSAQAEEVLQKIRATGTTVRFFSADISQQDSLATVLSTIQAEMPPLRGVIHAAGVKDDNLLLQMDQQQFKKVLAPKVQGAWNLHLLTAEMSLDFFVLFSSVTSLLNTIGVSNYAAGNAFLDGLAHYRRSQGLKGLSINWGAWADVGMLAKISKATRELWTTAEGLEEIPPQQGIQILHCLLEQPGAQYGAFIVNWALWLKHSASTRTGIPPLIADLVNLAALNQKPTGHTRQPTSRAETNAASSFGDSEPRLTFVEILRSVPPNQRQTRLTAYVRAELAQILGLSQVTQLDVQEGFSQMGLDSLMSVELRTRLQSGLDCALSPTVAFNYPTIEDIVQHLLRDVLRLAVSTETEQEASPSSLTPHPIRRTQAGGAEGDQDDQYDEYDEYEDEDEDELAALLSEIEALPDELVEEMFTT